MRKARSVASLLSLVVSGRTPTSAKVKYESPFYLVVIEIEGSCICCCSKQTKALLAVQVGLQIWVSLFAADVAVNTAATVAVDTAADVAGDSSAAVVVVE